VPACDLLVLGELNPDVVVACDGDVAFGQVEQVVERASIALGSSGAITAAAAAAQGLRVSFCGVVGDDPLGAMTVDLLAAQGVDVSAVVRRAGVSTGMTTVLTRPDGDRALLTYLGAMAELRAEDVAADLVAGARHVHVSSIFLQRGLQPGLNALLRDARDAGATTSVDPGWDPDERWTAARDVLGELDYLLPNAAECVHIAGATDSVLDAARELNERGPVIALKLGADGAALAGPDGIRVIRAEPAVPVDTTGAGDNFNAGFLAARLDGASLDDALARAVASGSISVGGWSGTGRMATRDEAVAAAARLPVTSEEIA
jgi:sugar/nucleoside kinase (ribokinase family)